MLVLVRLIRRAKNVRTARRVLANGSEIVGLLFPEVEGDIEDVEEVVDEEDRCLQRKLLLPVPVPLLFLPATPEVEKGWPRMVFEPEVGERVGVRIAGCTV